MKRFVCCLFIMAALPPLASPGHRISISPVIVTVAVAGEVTQTPCACSQPGCACPSQPTNKTAVAPRLDPIDELSSPSPDDVALGPVALALFLGLIVFARFGL